ncbi:MAG: carbohydrate porin [Candidatus Omnitrophota bacterium]
MRNAKLIVAAAFGAAVLCLSLSCYAQSGADLEARVTALEEQMKSAGVLEGLEMNIGFTMIVQGTSKANGSGIVANNIGHKENDTTDASYSADIEFFKQLDEQSSVFLHLETGENAGVTDDLELYSNVNQDANAATGNFGVSELYWEQNFDDQTFLTFGKIDATGFIDTNEYANDECSQFLSSMFKNSPAIEFPDNTIGLRAGTALLDVLSLDTVIADGDADFNQVGDSLWIGAQLTLQPNSIERKGNYRLYYWYNDTPHTKWQDASKTKESGQGFGISFDQELTERMGVFVRAGMQQDDAALDTSTFSLESAYSFGAQFNGSFWGRDNDILGLGCGQVMASDEYKKAGNLQAKTEGQVELYYNYAVSENLIISPDFQMINNPFGKDAVNGDDIIFVAGIRTQINF